MISIDQKGDFAALTTYLNKLNKQNNIEILNKYGKEGVRLLSSATPVRSGKTAASWYYKIEQSKNTISLNFYNSNINKGVPIAIILQYGHGTRNGGWVQGRDYINPVVQPLFNKIAQEAWKEVTKI
jgi:hypothetical protein